MKPKEVLKIFIPPIVFYLKDYIYNKVKVRNKSNTTNQLSQIGQKTNKIIIFGNGPSLTESINLYKGIILSYDRIVVNHFASTHYYEELKPNIYVFADPMWFVPEKQRSEPVEKTLRNIVQKTTWTLHVYVPLSASTSSALNILKESSFITIDFYQSTDQNSLSLTKFEAWDRNLLATPARNVLQTSLYLTLFWNYKEIYVIGADFSFIESIHIDQDTNELYMIEPHFYKDKAFEHRVKENLKLHEKLARMASTFKVFEELNEYAKYKCAKIYNASEFSWIDSFPRKKLSEPI